MLNYRSRLLKTQGMSTKVRVVLCVFGVFVCFIENAKILANGNCDKPPTTNSVAGVGGWWFVALLISIDPGNGAGTGHQATNQPKCDKPPTTNNVGGCWWLVVCRTFGFFLLQL